MKWLLPVILFALAMYQLRYLGADPCPRFVLKARRVRGVEGAFLSAWSGKRLRLALRVEWQVQAVLAI